MAGLLGGSWLSGKLAGKISPRQTILRGYMAMGAAAVLNLGICLVLPPGLPWSVLPIPLYTLGMSLAMPSLTLLSLDPFPDQRGLASSCQMFLQSIFNGLVAGVIAPAMWGSTHTLAFSMCALMLLGASSAWLHHRSSQAKP